MLMVVNPSSEVVKLNLLENVLLYGMMRFVALCVFFISTQGWSFRWFGHWSGGGGHHHWQWGQEDLQQQQHCLTICLSHCLRETATLHCPTVCCCIWHARADPALSKYMDMYRFHELCGQYAYSRKLTTTSHTGYFQECVYTSRDVFFLKQFMMFCTGCHVDLKAS